MLVGQATAILAHNQTVLIRQQMYLLSVIRILVNPESSFEDTDKELRKLDELTGAVKNLEILYSE